MFKHRSPWWKTCVAGGFAMTLLIGILEIAQASPPESESWSFRSPGTPGAAPAPASSQPLVTTRTSDREPESWAFRSPSADFKPATSPGRIGSSSSGGFAAPKDVVALAQKAGGCKTSGG